MQVMIYRFFHTNFVIFLQFCHLSIPKFSAACRINFTFLSLELKAFCHLFLPPIIPPHLQAQILLKQFLLLDIPSYPLPPSFLHKASPTSTRVQILFSKASLTIQNYSHFSPLKTSHLFYNSFRCIPPWSLNCLGRDLGKEDGYTCMEWDGVWGCEGMQVYACTWACAELLKGRLNSLTAYGHLLSNIAADIYLGLNTQQKQILSRQSLLCVLHPEGIRTPANHHIRPNTNL